MDEINEINSIKDINTRGLYMCLLYDNTINNFIQLGRPFVYDEGKFYDENGDGPWLETDIKKIQEYVDKFNEKNIKCFFTKFIPNKYKLFNNK